MYCRLKQRHFLFCAYSYKFNYNNLALTINVLAETHPHWRGNSLSGIERISVGSSKNASSLSY
uniref:Uncharacterized protein n=1 Tax=Heterorhabditis bacteriophora TaxID=37862 RepID=A0A1I7XV37_HETBA